MPLRPFPRNQREKYKIDKENNFRAFGKKKKKKKEKNSAC
jgi:hypothetical protein